MAQMPLLTYFCLGWVGLGLGSWSVSLITFMCFPTQHNLVNREHHIMSDIMLLTDSLHGLELIGSGCTALGSGCTSCVRRILSDMCESSAWSDTDLSFRKTDKLGGAYIPFAFSFSNGGAVVAVHAHLGPAPTNG